MPRLFTEGDYMNDERRKYMKTVKKNLGTALSLIEDAKTYTEMTLEEETESYENFPEKFQTSMVYENIEENVTILEELQDELETVSDEIENMIDLTKQVLVKKKR